MGLFDNTSKFESSVKQIPYSQEAVYRNISDLRNLEKVRDRIPEDKVKDFSFDADTISINVTEPTGIWTMSTEDLQRTSVLYNLQGVRVKHPGKGIYIRNGRKYKY